MGVSWKGMVKAVSKSILCLKAYLVLSQQVSYPGSE